MESRSELEAVLKAALGGTTVLTGNTRAARFLLDECDKLLVQSGLAWKTPDILPFTAWVQRTFREAQVAGATQLILLNSRQSQSLWQQSIAQSGAMVELFQPTNASGQAAEAWEQLHAYRIALDSSFEATAQARAFAGWARRYRQVCTKNRFTDSACAADEISKIARSGALQLPMAIHLWGCGDLTPQLADLIEAVKEAEVEVVTHRFEEPTRDHAARIACDDSDTELRRAAAFARDALTLNPGARVGVVLLKLREQRARAEAIFMETLHPEFYVGAHGPRAFEISLGDSLASHPLVGAALGQLRFSVQELKFEELRELLLSPYLGGAESESQERARLCRWLGDRVPEQLSIQRLLNLLKPSEHSPRAAEELKRIDVPKLRNILLQLSRPEGMPTRAAMSDWATLLGRLLRATGWPGEEDKKLSSLNFQAYTKWLELLSDLASLDVVQGQVTLQEAVKEIVSAATAQTFAPENLGAPVQIMDEQEASGSLFDQMWIAGLDDETWPRRRSGSAFIPAQLLRAAKVPGSTPESQTAEAKKAMARLLSSASLVMLSHPLLEGDRKLRVSPGIKSANKVAWSGLKIEDVESWMERMAGVTAEEFEDCKAPAVADGELLHRGTSLLEKQSACPFWAFAELRLGAKHANQPSAGIEPRIRGNLIEDVLDGFWREARDLENLRKVSEEDRKVLIARAVDQALRKHLGNVDSTIEIEIREIERERLIELTKEWLVLEDKRAPFDMVRHQQEFSYTVAGVELRGRIDRIDRSVTHLGEVITDYKAGSGERYKKNSWEMPRPRLPQLPLYAAYVQSQGKNVVGLGFGILNTAKSKVEGMAASRDIFGSNSHWPKWAEPTLGQQITAWAKEIERLVTEHVEGAANVDPKVPPSRSNSSCERCHLQAMCRVAEATVINGDDEEDGDE